MRTLFVFFCVWSLSAAAEWEAEVARVHARFVPPPARLKTGDAATVYFLLAREARGDRRPACARARARALEHAADLVHRRMIPDKVLARLWAPLDILLARHTLPGRARDALHAICDDLDCWHAGHLRLLVNGLRSRHRDEPELFFNRLVDVLVGLNESEREGLARLLREPKVPRGDRRCIALLRTGFASADDIGQLLYARALKEMSVPGGPLLQSDDEDLHEVFVNFMGDFIKGDAYAVAGVAYGRQLAARAVKKGRTPASVLNFFDRIEDGAPKKVIYHDFNGK